LTAVREEISKKDFDPFYLTVLGPQFEGAPKFVDISMAPMVELVPTVMIDDLDKSCAKAEPNFDK
jgi:hypothetical protein